MKLREESSLEIFQCVLGLEMTALRGLQMSFRRVFISTLWRRLLLLYGGDRMEEIDSLLKLL